MSLFFAGTEEERGIRKWRNLDVESSPDSANSTDVYSIHFIQKYFDKVSAFRFVPFCPSFAMNQKRSDGKIDSMKSDDFSQQGFDYKQTENTKL